MSVGYTNSIVKVLQALYRARLSLVFNRWDTFPVLTKSLPSGHATRQHS